MQRLSQSKIMSAEQSHYTYRYSAEGYQCGEHNSDGSRPFSVHLYFLLFHKFICIVNQFCSYGIGFFSALSHSGDIRLNLRFGA